MYNFLLSGYVPGTNIQVTFRTWLYGICLLTLAYIVLKPFIKRRLNRFMANLLLEPAHRPLHASRLHHRRHQTAQ